MMTLFEQEYAVERYGDEKRAEGKAEGRTEGEVNKAKEMAFSLFQMGVPIEKIAEAAKLDVGLVKNWLIESGTVGAKNKQGKKKIHHDIKFLKILWCIFKLPRLGQYEKNKEV